MMLPIVLPRVSGGTSVMTVVINSGIMIAVPDAWITRATTSSSRPGAIAAASVPSENSDIARMKTDARVQALQQEARHRDDDGHREQERRRHPLRGRRRDAEARHERRDRDAHDRLVQDHDERRDEQQIDDESVAARRACRGGVESRGVHVAILPRGVDTPVIFRESSARVAALRVAFGGWRLRIVRHCAGQRQLVERHLL